MVDMTRSDHYYFAIQQHLESSFNLVAKLWRGDVKFDWDFGLTSEGDGKQSPESCAVWVNRDLDYNSRALWFKARLENACNTVGYTIEESYPTGAARYLMIISKSKDIEDAFESAYCYDNDC